jgi:hypothetical protein
MAENARASLFPDEKSPAGMHSQRTRSAPGDHPRVHMISPVGP